MRLFLISFLFAPALTGSTTNKSTADVIPGCKMSFNQMYCADTVSCDFPYSERYKKMKFLRISDSSFLTFRVHPNYKSLEVLIINYGMLERFYFRNFVAFTRLKKLKLIDNNLDLLDTRGGEALTQLQYIHIEGGSIPKLTDNSSFALFPHLQWLRLSHLGIKVLKERFLPRSLKFLFLSGEDEFLLNFPEFWKFPSLQLDMRNIPVYCDCLFLSRVIDNIRNSETFRGKQRFRCVRDSPLVDYPLAQSAEALLKHDDEHIRCIEELDS